MLLSFGDRCVGLSQGPASWVAPWGRGRGRVLGDSQQRRTVYPNWQPWVLSKADSGKSDICIEIVFMVENKVSEEAAVPHPGHGADL